jgi:hypothetical protein
MGSAKLMFVTPDGKKLVWQNFILVDHMYKSSGYYISNLDDSEQEHILPNIFASQADYLSPSGQYILYHDFSKGDSRTCYGYNISNKTSTRIPPDSNAPRFTCSSSGTGIPWSPTEDKFLGTTEKGYTIWTASDGTMNEIATYAEVGYCFTRWTPDGKSLFLNNCTDSLKKFSELFSMDVAFHSSTDFPFNEFLGQYLIDLSSGGITKYPDTGFCNTVISPDSKWVLIYACKNEQDLVVYPSQMLNLITKEMVPVFQDFVADSNENIAQPPNTFIDARVWSIIWTP